MSAVVYWTPMFKDIEYLQQIVFPFVMVYPNDEEAGFEAVVTFLLTWCQHWFVYYSHPPVTFLAAIDEVILAFDSKLLKHLHMIGADNTHYSWPFLRSMYSEALTKDEWLRMMDFMIVERDRPEFLIFFTAACVMNFGPAMMQIEYIDDLSTFMNR
jgi:hypothetical protein